MLKYWLQMTRTYLNAEDGQGMVEYGLIIALVAIIVIGTLAAIGGKLDGVFNTIKDALPG